MDSNPTWLPTARVALPAGSRVERGQEVTFAFEVVAPTTPGAYPFHWRMFQDGGPWFGDTTPYPGTPVRVADRAPAPALTLGPQLAAVKVRPNDAVANAGLPADVKGARGEGVAVQVVLRSTGDLKGVVPQLAALTGPGGATIPGAAVQLYKVGYIDVTKPSDPAGVAGEWPDVLYPIDRDRSSQPQWNGAPFELRAGRNQPMWIDVRIPRDATPGLYTAMFRVTQEPGGAVLAELPLRLTVWNFTLPEASSLPTTYKLNTWGAYCTHYFPDVPVARWIPDCHWDEAKIDDLTDRYVAHAAAHRITLDALVRPLAYTYDDATRQVTISAAAWKQWDRVLEKPGVTSFPLPGPKFSWNNPKHTWTDAETREAIALWREVAKHYRARGWFEHSFLYTFDEPHALTKERVDNGHTVPEQLQLVATQSNALHQADPELRALVTSSYDLDLATKAQIDIWVPVVNHLVEKGDPAVVYAPERAKGKEVWWYDSLNSNARDHSHLHPGSDEASHHGKWPDEYIDHQGVNQLVHGLLTWRYGLQGYLYYATNENYTKGRAIWRDNYSEAFGGNGDGTLFYPGRPEDIGGSGHIPLPSIRLQLLRQSWSMYDMLVMLRDRNMGREADEIVRSLVTAADAWKQDARAYEDARELMASRLSSP